MNALEVENIYKSYQAVRTLPGGNGGRAPGLHALARLFLGETFGQLGRRAVTPVTALDGVSLAVEPGQAVGLYGRNGSGKTTLLSIVGGVFFQDSGSVRCFGYDTSTHRRQVQRHVVPVFGWLDGITWAFTGRQNVEKLLVMHHVEPARFAHEIDGLARDVGLHDRLDDRAARYSQGMRIKLQLIAALLLQRACAPSLLLLDEPFLGLDVFTQGTLRRLLRQSRQRGGLSILLATHQAADIEAICDRVVVLDEGRIVARGAVEELRRRSGTETVCVEYVPPGGRPLPDAFFRQAGALACESRPRDGRAEAVLLVEDGRAAPARLAAALQEAGCPVTSLRVRETGFEDVLARLTEGAMR